MSSDRFRGLHALERMHHDRSIASTASSSEQRVFPERMLHERRRGHLLQRERRGHLEQHALGSAVGVLEQKNDCVPEEVVYLLGRSNEHTSWLYRPLPPYNPIRLASQQREQTAASSGVAARAGGRGTEGRRRRREGREHPGTGRA
eukprot:763989-Hanusia_phi.AAC.7